MDRYYNPSAYTQFQALSTDSPLTYTDDFTTVDSNINTANYAVYDKLSNLTLEAGGLYAYHRIGDHDIKKATSVLQENIQNNLDNYQDAKGNSKTPDFDSDNNPIYIFDGNARAKTTPASDISKSSNATISFHMHSDDWSKPLGLSLIHI